MGCKASSTIYRWSQACWRIEYVSLAEDWVIFEILSMLPLTKLWAAWCLSRIISAQETMVSCCSSLSRIYTFNPSHLEPQRACCAASMHTYTLVGGIRHSAKLPKIEPVTDFATFPVFRDFSEMRQENKTPPTMAKHGGTFRETVSTFHRSGRNQILGKLSTACIVLGAAPPGWTTNHDAQPRPPFVVVPLRPLA